MVNNKIITFTDLNTWKEGHKLVLMVYKTTDKFPSKETFSLIDQMRRAAVSLTSNIAEGFTRAGIKEKIQFYLMAKGSLTELQNQLYVAKRTSTSEPFGPPQVVAGQATLANGKPGFNEGAFVSRDGNLLYYHHLDLVEGQDPHNARFSIYVMSR